MLTSLFILTNAVIVQIPGIGSWLPTLQPAERSTNLLYLSVVKLGEHRQAHDLARRRLGYAAGGGTKRHAVAIGRLQMHRHRIVDAAADASRAQLRLHGVAPGHTQHVEVEDVFTAAATRRWRDRGVGQRPVVRGRDCAPPPVLHIEMRKLHP